jgi:arylesterase/paraoxonase
MRVRKTLNGYEVIKILEDGKGEILPAATTVVHDAVTGRLFLSGEQFISNLAPVD